MRRSTGRRRWAPSRSTISASPMAAGWLVMADPEGNEFCILRSDAERARRPAERLERVTGIEPA